MAVHYHLFFKSDHSDYTIIESVAHSSESAAHHKRTATGFLGEYQIPQNLSDREKIPHLLKAQRHVGNETIRKIIDSKIKELVDE